MKIYIQLCKFSYVNKMRRRKPRAKRLLRAGLRFRFVRRGMHRRPYAYSTLMVFVLPLRPLMMPPVMMTLSPFSSGMTARLTCSAW